MTGQGHRQRDGGWDVNCALCRVDVTHARLYGVTHSNCHLEDPEPGTAVDGLLRVCVMPGEARRQRAKAEGEAVAKPRLDHKTHILSCMGLLYRARPTSRADNTRAGRAGH